MGDIKYSSFLTLLITRAKCIGTIQAPPATAERFLIAVIDSVENGEQDKDEQEFSAVKALVEKSIKNRKKAKDMLMVYICQEPGTFLDDLYMKKKLNEAEIRMSEENKTQIDAELLLSCIFQSPSEIVRKMLRICSAPMEKADETKPKTIKEQIDDFLLPTEELILDIPEADDEELVFEDFFEGDLPVPVKREMAKLVADVKRIREELRSVIFGQDNAINVFVTGYFQSSMMAMLDKSRKRPRATFLFAGPPGVGKTFLAEQAAKSLDLPFMRFDMSEYSDKEANIEFCGSDKVYRNAKAGNVTSFVEANPKCVLLFDEIEKAHIGVIHLFLQILDAGRLRDNYTDKEVPFNDVIIILTTNAGKQLYEENESGDFSAVSRKVIVKALQTDKNPKSGVPYFPAAICSRFASGNVVMFNHMAAHNLRTIAKKEIEKHTQNLRQETGIEVRIDERVYTALLFSEGSAADARTVRSRAETFFNDELYELMRLIGSEKVATGVEDVEKIQISVDLSRTKREIAKLFRPAEKIQFLMFAEEEKVTQLQKQCKTLDVIGAQDPETAIAQIKNQDIGFVLLDVSCGMTAPATSLNIEDVDSPARDFFKFLREQGRGLPVYLLEEESKTLNEEERISFLRQGVRDVLRKTEKTKEFVSKLQMVAEILHQQASMNQLARQNKLIRFETAQTVSADGKTAKIKLFDFSMDVAIESEDAKNILSAVSKPNVRFSEVIGAQDAKQELTYFVEYLRNPKKYMGTGVKAPRGVLLYGPPGTGKTMLAKAMACEADVTFIAAEGNEFLKRVLGEGSDRVHQLFKTARKYAPSILFIDEIDAIARERKGGAGAASTGEDTLTAFLTEMDGFINDPTRPVFVLAATNFDVEPGGAKSLDPALMRRFDRRVYIDLPNREDRTKFLKMKFAGNPAFAVSKGQIEQIAMRSTSMSLAELDSVTELALRSAIREGSTTVTDSILEEAFETFNGGAVKKWDRSQLERVARHEAGHALLYWLNGETPAYLTIVARADHGGYMQHAEQEGKGLFTYDELIADIQTSLGGRAAEIAYYGTRGGISTGAASDLMKSTGIARRIVCAYGMDEDFGLAVVSGPEMAEGAMSMEIRAAVNRILKEQMEKAIRVVSENKDLVDALVKELMNRNQMTGAQIDETLSRAKQKRKK